MPSVGPLEILVIFVIALVIFGPDKLPDIARQAGKAMSEFRRVQHHLRRELDDAVHSVMDEDSAAASGAGQTPSSDEKLDVPAPSAEGPSSEPADPETR